MRLAAVLWSGSGGWLLPTVIGVLLEDVNLGDVQSEARVAIAKLLRELVGRYWVSGEGI